jgi:hypothetical protein
MQKKLTLITLIGVSAASLLTLAGCSQHKVEAVAFTNPNRVIMPYRLAPDAANKSLPILPIKNQHLYYPGCYIACYSHSKKNGVYSVGNNIYAIGAIRVAGHYEANICKPVGYRHKNISASTKFNELCNNSFSSCHGKCWAGGDTIGVMRYNRSNTM